MHELPPLVPPLPEVVVLGAGARLWRLKYLHDPQTNRGSHVRSDVTDEAGARLFESVQLDPELTLRDVFRFVRANKVLRAVLERQWVEDLLQEASPYLGCAEDEARTARWAPLDDLLEVPTSLVSTEEGAPTAESLVLCAVGEADRRLQLQGDGFDLRDAIEFAGIPAAYFDEVNAWKMDRAVAWRLLDLRVHLGRTSSAAEVDASRTPGGDQEDAPALAQPTLGDVLQAVFGGLSCLVGARERQPELNRADGPLEEPDDVDVGTLLKRIFAGPLDENLAG